MTSGLQIPMSEGGKAAAEPLLTEKGIVIGTLWLFRITNADTQGIGIINPDVGPMSARCLLFNQFR